MTFQVNEIIEKTTILNALLGLKDYDIENCQKKVEENIQLFIILLDKYIPNWEKVYLTAESKQEALYVKLDIARLQQDMQIYRDQRSNLLSVLTLHIMSPAVRLRNKIDEYEKEKEYTLSEIMDDMTEILVRLGIPEILTTWNSRDSFFCTL